MTCQEIAEFLLAYHADELPATQRLKFDQHLAECDECVEYLRTYRTTINLFRQALTGDDSIPVPESLIRAVTETMRN